MRPAEPIGDHIVEVAAKGGDEQVEPPIVVVVPEPAREAVLRLGDAELGGHVGEGAVAVVAVEAIRRGHVGDIEVGPAVAIVIAPRGALAEAVVPDACASATSVKVPSRLL